jgi:hypothetical protein
MIKEPEKQLVTNPPAKESYMEEMPIKGPAKSLLQQSQKGQVPMMMQIPRTPTIAESDDMQLEGNLTLTQWAGDLKYRSEDSMKQQQKQFKQQNQEKLQNQQNNKQNKKEKTQKNTHTENEYEIEDDILFGDLPNHKLKIDFNYDESHGEDDDDDENKDEENDNSGDGDDFDDDNDTKLSLLKKTSKKKVVLMKKDDDGKNKPRKSILKRLIQQANEPRNEVHFTEVRPSYKDIQLSRLNVLAVMKFVNQIVDYTTGHGLDLPVSTLIDKKIRQHIISRVEGLNVYKFHRLNTETIITLLQELVRPQTVLDFQKALEKYVEFPTLPRNYRPTVVDFKLFYDAILEYKTNFQDLYEVLAENNQDNIPQANNKEGGLIKIFLCNMPFTYGDNVIKSVK